MNRADMTWRVRSCAVLVTVLLLAVALLVPVGAGPHGAEPRLFLLGDQSKHAGEFIVPVSKSQILRLDVPFSDLLVGDPGVADVLALSDRSIYVLGKSLGATSLTIYDRDKHLVAVVDVLVGPDIEGLKKRLFELIPDERVEIRSLNGSVVLSGRVSGAGRMSKVLAIAERFAPGLVTNLLTVEGSQQVMLKVRFVEVSRSALKGLGLNFDLLNGDFSFTSGDTFLATPGALAGTGGFVLGGDSFGSGLFSGNVGTMGLQLLFEALETKGVAKTLAEPNLIALSGDTASFLAGGEFPIEVAQSGASATGDAAITIEFKEFGISLAFTPTVLDDGLINMVVSPEVSTLDFTVATANGTPGLTTRRATTTVELRDGQAFAIAGLLQDDFQDTIRQVPVLGDIPVLGTLFRSSQYQRNETELVIVVEAHLVQPARAGTLATPADHFIPPSDVDLWLFGRVEAAGSGAPAESEAQALTSAGVGGLDGRYGHILK